MAASDEGNSCVVGKLMPKNSEREVLKNILEKVAYLGVHSHLCVHIMKYYWQKKSFIFNQPIVSSKKEKLLFSTGSKEL